jgi:hypothetical protein
MLLSRQGLKSFLPSCVAAPLPQIARRALLDHEPGLLLLIADSNVTAVPSEYDVLAGSKGNTSIPRMDAASPSPNLLPSSGEESETKTLK